MNGSQQSLNTTTGSAATASDPALSSWVLDDDVALGCECANPALQIERWGQEAAPSVPAY